MSDSFDSNPYQPPAGRPPAESPVIDPTLRPQVVVWQVVYCAVMVFVYIAVAVLGLFFFLKSAMFADAQTSEMEIRLMGIIYGVLGAVFTVVFAAGLFWRRGMGGWVFNMVLICFGLTSCCTWPATIPLLLQWLKHKDRIIAAEWLGEG